MKTTSITEFNKEELINVSNHLHFSNNEKKPVVKHLTFNDFSTIGFTLETLLDAIEFIGFNGDKEDLSTCAGLAEIAKKILPTDELEFLDKLLVEKERFGEKKPFTPIENLFKPL